MRLTTIFCLILLLAGCTSTGEDRATKEDDTKEITSENGERAEEKPEGLMPTPSKLYSNERFREVWVERVGEHSFRVQGQARVFEATVNWVVEDGHMELKEGFVTADAGGPEWGAFDFTLEVQKERTHSSLTLILFESSAKDGSRQGELPIPLY
nr:Gmad2 immunoglobulin-like domain-containing protein [Saprospiraceae bacterium]